LRLTQLALDELMQVLRLILCAAVLGLLALATLGTLTADPGTYEQPAFKMAAPILIYTSDVGPPTEPTSGFASLAGVSDAANPGDLVPQASRLAQQANSLSNDSMHVPPLTLDASARDAREKKSTGPRRATRCGSMGCHCERDDVKCHRDAVASLIARSDQHRKRNALYRARQTQQRAEFALRANAANMTVERWTAELLLKKASPPPPAGTGQPGTGAVSAASDPQQLKSAPPPLTAEEMRKRLASKHDLLKRLVERRRARLNGEGPERPWHKRRRARAGAPSSVTDT
jgi:hypothetical protein